jgi:hypothetical protein
MDGRRDSFCPAACRVDAGDPYFRIKQQVIAADDALGETTWAPPSSAIVVSTDNWSSRRAGRRYSAATSARRRPRPPSHQQVLVVAQGAQEFGAAALDETQVVGVIDDAAASVSS